MTKDTSPGTQGGTKKFLYGGPRKRIAGQGFEDEEQEVPTFNYNYNSSFRKHPDPQKFDIDGIWGLKDLAVPKLHEKSKGRRGDTESWDLNVGKSYYSRHGNSEPTRDQTSPRRNYTTSQNNLTSTSQKSVTNSQTSNTLAKTWHNHMHTSDNTKDHTFDF